jgi:hypothetical protein
MIDSPLPAGQQEAMALRRIRMPISMPAELTLRMVPPFIPERLPR